MGAQCAECHEERTWRGARFDHSKTKFPLEGKHEKVACATCHPAERWAGTPKECVACHTVQDVHRGSMGSDCKSCHDTSDWKKSRFDHDKTKFSLTGKHRTASCESCHTGGSFEKALATDCLSCHRTDDVHEDRRALSVLPRHDGVEARVVRSRSRRQFPLRGAREDALRVLSPRRRTRRSSIGLHLVPSQGRPARCSAGENCERCHGDAGWREKVSFDHDLARFPLLGLHASAPCEACHASAVYRGTPRTCLECHGADDRHERRLGPVCELPQRQRLGALALRSRRCRRRTHCTELTRRPHAGVPSAAGDRLVEAAEDLHGVPRRRRFPSGLVPDVAAKTATSRRRGTR